MMSALPIDHDLPALLSQIPIQTSHDLQRFAGDIGEQMLIG
ncbi:hypothetical protein ABK730_24790 [Klebsiella indica]|nr:hypothetical protein [Klebsiella indica]